MSSIIKVGKVQSSTGNDAVTVADSGIITMASGNGYRFAGMQVFTSDGTYTKSPNVSAIYVIVTGSAGGGGGGADNWNLGGGGGAGGTAIKWITSGIGTEDVTIGNAGQGGATQNDGTNGQNCTFGSSGGFTQLVGGGGIKGGAGNTYVAGNSLGGTATGGDINIPGGDGTSASGGDIADESIGGVGGASYWGGGGKSGSAYGNKDGTSARVYGAGGGGGREEISTAASGGNGMTGIVVVYEYI